MGWGSRRWAKLAWAAVAALGLAALPAIAATNAAEGGNEKSGGTERGIRFGIDREEYDAQARAAMQVDPVVAAQLGAIRKVTLDEAASMDEPGPDVLVFDVEGSRGKGRVTARFITVSATQEALGPGMLVMADGTRATPMRWLRRTATRMTMSMMRISKRAPASLPGRHRKPRSVTP